MSAIAVKHECSGCSKFFVDGFEFPEMYTCNDCGEFWSKDDGRNCQQCHKFGSNTEEPVCPDCSQEVSEVDVLVDPEKEDIMGADGNEIVTPKKAKVKKMNEKEVAKRLAESKVRRAKWEHIFKAGIKKYAIKNSLGNWNGEVVAMKSVSVIGNIVSVYACATLASSFQFDGSGLPYEIEFRIKSDGYQGKNNDHGGFNYPCGDSLTFAELKFAVDYAKAMINLVWVIEE